MGSITVHKVISGCPQGKWDAKKEVCSKPVQIHAILNPLVSSNPSKPEAKAKAARIRAKGVRARVVKMGKKGYEVFTDGMRKVRAKAKETVKKVRKVAKPAKKPKPKKTPKPKKAPKAPRKAAVAVKAPVPVPAAVIREAVKTAPVARSEAKSEPVRKRTTSSVEVDTGYFVKLVGNLAQVMDGIIFDTTGDRLTIKAVDSAHVCMIQVDTSLKVKGTTTLYGFDVQKLEEAIKDWKTGTIELEFASNGVNFKNTATGKTVHMDIEGNPTNPKLPKFNMPVEFTLDELGIAKFKLGVSAIGEFSDHVKAIILPDKTLIVTGQGETSGVKIGIDVKNLRWDDKEAKVKASMFPRDYVYDVLVRKFFDRTVKSCIVNVNDDYPLQVKWSYTDKANTTYDYLFLLAPRVESEDSTLPADRIDWASKGVESLKADRDSISFKISTLTNIFRGALAIHDEFAIQPNPDTKLAEMKLVDTAHVMMLQIGMPFKLKTPVIFGDADNVYAVLKLLEKYGKDDPSEVFIMADDEHYVLSQPEADLQAIYHQMDASGLFTAKMPALNLPISVDCDRTAIKAIINAVKELTDKKSEFITFAVDTDGHLNVSGIVKQEDTGDEKRVAYDIPATASKRGEVVKSTFPGDYLLAFCRKILNNSIDSITLELGSDFPLRVTFNIAEDSSGKYKAIYLLAPRVESNPKRKRRYRSNPPCRHPHIRHHGYSNPGRTEIKFCPDCDKYFKVV